MQKEDNNREINFNRPSNSKNIIGQSIGEMNLWKKILAFLQQEHLSQKNKLVEILRNNKENAGDILEIAEGYQNKFLQQDEAFRLMWNDMVQFERSLGEIYGHRDKDIIQRRKKLRQELEILDANFYELKTDFNKLFDFFFADNYSETWLAQGGKRR